MRTAEVRSYVITEESSVRVCPLKEERSLLTFFVRKIRMKNPPINVTRGRYYLWKKLAFPLDNYSFVLLGDYQLSP